MCMIPLKINFRISRSLVNSVILRIHSDMDLVAIGTFVINIHTASTYIFIYILAFGSGVDVQPEF